MQQNLTHQTLGTLDGGRAGEIIDAAILEVLRDLKERGHIGKRREVTLKLRFEMDEAEKITVSLETGSKRPGWTTSPHTAQLRTQRGQPTLNFQELDRKDPEQRTFDDVDKE